MDVLNPLLPVMPFHLLAGRKIWFYLETLDVNLPGKLSKNHLGESVGATYISHSPVSPLNQQNVPPQSHLSSPRERNQRKLYCQLGWFSHMMEQCHHTMQGADASCHSTVEMWILNLQDFCPFLSLGRLLWLEPHPRAWISGTRLCFQPRAQQHRAVDPQARPCEGVGWGCQHFAKYSPVSMETGSPHLKFQFSAYWFDGR